MIGIYKKELVQYFTSFIGYIFICAFLVISGIYFYIVNLASLNSDIKVFFNSIASVIIFLIPMLTMRIYSEERKQKTEELLLTSPIRIYDIIVGKYLAAMTVFGIPLVITCAFPIILSIYGTPQILVTIGNYFGIVLLASAFVAIGIFISVLAENQLVSAICTYSILLMLFTLDSIAVFVSNSIILKIVELLSIKLHYEQFTYGVLNIADVVYFLSISVLFIFLSIHVLERKKIL